MTRAATVAFVLWFLFLPSAIPIIGANELGAISGVRMLDDVQQLASPAFEGRQTGTRGDVDAAQFVASRLSALGLRVPGSVRNVTAQSPVTRLEDGTGLILRSGAESIPAVLTDDYLPVLDSPSVHVEAPVIFVGYGVADPARHYDEYGPVDVRGRIVLFLRGQPPGYPAPVTHADKERTARDKGAAAFLMATGPILTPYELRRDPNPAPKAFYTVPAQGPPLPGAWVSTALAERLVGGRTRSLREMQEQLNRMVPQSHETGTAVELAWTARHSTGALIDVLGWMPGTATGNDHIIIGAHRDHFGRQAGLLFPGADDNASGTAVLLEVARVLVASDTPLKRAVLFVSFSGEEQGLRGSRLYVDRPEVPLASSRAMVNIDHAGVGNGRLTVGVTGVTHERAREAAATAGVAEFLDLYGFFPGGDHVPFKEAGIPTVTVVSGGLHPHFHRPSDTPDTVDPEILERVARYVLALVTQLAND